MTALARWWTVPAAAPLAAAAVAGLRRAAAVDWDGRVALVAGASRGLGLAIARELVGHGARVAIAARDDERLEGAAAELRDSGGEVRAIPTDVGDPSRAQALVDEVVDWQGRLDALFNVAGVIQVAPLETLTIGDFEEAIDVMALGPIACALAALPALRDSDAGRVANITSIGGKVPVPHLIPYAAAKHAAVGFSESLRAELGPRGVRVTTVVPGFMRTGSHIHAQIKGPHAKQYRWFATLSQLPMVAMRADRAARRIVAATARGDAEVTTTWWAPIASRAHGLAPGLGTRAAGMIAPALPDAHEEPSGVEGRPEAPEEAVPGHEIRTGTGPLSKRAERAITEFRQHPRRTGA